MERLVAEQCDLRILREKIVDRGCPGFLHAGDDEIDAFNFAASEKIRLRFALARLHVPNS